MIIDAFKYIWRGFLHYVNLLFGLLDFRDLGFMWIILIGILIIGIFNKNVRNSIIGLIHPFINVIKTLPGFIFFALFLSYYIYISIFFEEKITIVILIFSIYLFIKDFVKTNLNLLLESENTIWDSIKDISIPVIMLCFQQLAIMFENNNLDNIKFVLISLVIIPIFSILFFIMKHYCIYTDFYSRHKQYISIDEYSFFKIFNDCLVECGNYKKNEIILSKFIIKNKNLPLNQLKQKLDVDINAIIKVEELNNFGSIHSKAKKQKSKIFKFYNRIWIFNIFCISLCIVLKRFMNLPFDFWYYVSFTILIIYFWYDLMKIKKIENQFDYIMYMFIYIILIVILLIYNHLLNDIRLTELGFLVPIFIILRIYTYYKDFPNLQMLPFLSKNNFFNLNPTDYKINNSNQSKAKKK